MSQYDLCATPGTTTPPLSPQSLMVKGKVAILLGGSWSAAHLPLFLAARGPENWRPRALPASGVLWLPDADQSDDPLRDGRERKRLLLSNSLRSPSSLAHAGPFSLFTQFRVGNYREAASAIDPYLLNTVIVTAISVAIGVPVAALAAYGFAIIEFRGRDVLFAAFLGLLLIPWTLTLIPLFAEMRGFRLYGNWGAWSCPTPRQPNRCWSSLTGRFLKGSRKRY